MEVHVTTKHIGTVRLDLLAETHKLETAQRTVMCTI